VINYPPIKRLPSDERGATAIEYGLICAMIATVVISIVGVGGGLALTWDKLQAVIAVFGA
jgi:Flp pilus assembly pilin Flp